MDVCYQTTCLGPSSGYGDFGETTSQPLDGIGHSPLASGLRIRAQIRTPILGGVFDPFSPSNAVNSRPGEDSRVMLTVLRRAVFAITRIWTLPVQQRLEALLLAKMNREDVLGFEVCMEPNTGTVLLVTGRIREALLLLGRTDPRRFARIQRDLRRFVVSPVTNVSGAHFPKSWTCYLSSRLAEDFPVPNLAIVIVHEATHARIDHAGVPLYPDWRARIDLRCMLEEITFARRLSTTEHPGIAALINDRERGLL